MPLWSILCADPNVWSLVLKLTLVVELWALLSSHDHHCSSTPLRRSLAVQLSGKAQKILSTLTLVRAIVHWCLHAETHPGGEVASAVIIFWWCLGGSVVAYCGDWLPYLCSPYCMQPTSTTRDYCAAKIQAIKRFIELWRVQVRKELVESKVAPFSYL